MKNIQNKIRITFLITLISVTTAFADDDPGFGYDGDPGTPAAPIENYIVLLFILAIVLGFYVVQKSFTPNKL